MSDAYFTEMSRFRDRVLALAAGKQPGRDIPAAHLYVGPIDAASFAKMRDSLAPATFLLIYHAPSDAVHIEDLAKNIRSGERTLFCPLVPEAFCADKAGVITSLFLNHNVTLAISDTYATRYEREIREIRTSLELAGSNAEKSYFGRLIYLRNAIINLRYMDAARSRIFTPMEQQLPAAVCSAGPSLKHSLPLLREYADRILIICVYRALPLLLEAGINPDFVVQVDPSDIMKSMQFKPDELPPLVAASSISPVIAAEFNEIIWSTGDSPEFNALGDELDIPRLPLHISRSVTVTAIDFARYAGCRKIALLGSDLCLAADGRCYADTAEQDIGNGFFIQVKGTSEDVVTTDLNLDLIRESIQRYIQGAKTGPGAPSFYNCSERGANIEGCRNISLEKFCSSFAGELKGHLPLSAVDRGVSDDVMQTLRRQARSASTAAENIIKHASRLSNSLRNSSNEAKKIKSEQQLLSEAIKAGADAMSTRPLSRVLRAYEQQTAEMDFRLFPAVMANDPFGMLEQIIRTNRFIKFFIDDLITDISSEAQGDLRRYNCLREIFLQLQQNRNPRLAEFLRCSPECRDFADNTSTGLNHLRLPFFLTLPDRRKVFTDSPTPGMEVGLRRYAKLRNRKFLETAGIATADMALVYVTAGNFYHLDELRLRRADLPTLVVMPWAGVADILSQRCLIDSFLPENTTLVCVDADPEWLEFCRKKIDAFKAAGKRLCLMKTPSADALPEVNEIFGQLNVLVQASGGISPENID